jgi:hypothetical protein
MTDKTIHDDSTRLALIEQKVDGLGASLTEIKTSLATSATAHVTRPEWELRNKLVDERHEAMMRKQAPWWNAVAVILSACALGWVILGPAITR